MKTLTREQLEQALSEILGILVDEDGFWREDVSGADAVDSLSLILSTSGIASHVRDRKHDESDGPLRCPDCETPTQFGERCEDCVAEAARYYERQKGDDDGVEYGHPGDYKRGLE